MYRQRALTIPADTSLNNAASLKFEIPAGQIKLITVEFPAGVHDYAFIQLLQSNTPIMPDEDRMGITGEDVTLQLPVIHDIAPGKNELTIKGWSPGSSKEHTIRIGVVVFSLEEKSREEAYLSDMARNIEAIRKMLGV